MATKSILKNVDIKSRNAALALVNALENARGKSSATPDKTRTFSTATRDEIRKMFGEVK